MSPINSALQYKIQKMERQLSSLMEENAALKQIISEASGIAGAYTAGGGAGIGQYLASQPNVGYADQPETAMNSGYGTSMSRNRTGIGARAGMRSAVAPGGGVGAGQFDGAQLGSLLAQAGQDGGAAANSYLNQFGYGLTPLSVSGAQSADNRRRTNPLATRR